MSRVLLLLFMIFSTVPLAACEKDETALNCYKILETSAVTYDLVMKAGVELHNQGAVTNEQYGKLKDAAILYFDAYQVAVGTLAAYVDVTDSVNGEKPTEEELKVIVDKISEHINYLILVGAQLGIDVDKMKAPE